MVDLHNWEVIRQALEHAAHMGDHVEHVRAYAAEQIGALKETMHAHHETIETVAESAEEVAHHVAEEHHEIELAHEALHAQHPFMNREAIGAAVHHAVHGARGGIADLVRPVAETLSNIKEAVADAVNRPPEQAGQNIASPTDIQWSVPEIIAPSTVPSQGISDVFNQAAAPPPPPPTMKR